MKPEDLKSIIACYPIPSYAHTADNSTMPQFIALMLNFAHTNKYQTFSDIQFLKLVYAFFSNPDSTKDPIQRTMMTAILINSPQIQANETLLKSLEKLIIMKPGLFVIKLSALRQEKFNLNSLTELIETTPIIDLKEISYSEDKIDALLMDCLQLADCFDIIREKENYKLFGHEPTDLSPAPTDPDCGPRCIIL